MAKNQQTEEKYMAIRLSASRKRYIPSNRYINWIDEHWYETIKCPNYDIPESKIDDVKKWLRNHFIHYVAFMHADGTTEEWNVYMKKEKKKSQIKLKAGKTFSFTLKKHQKSHFLC